MSTCTKFMVIFSVLAGLLLPPWYVSANENGVQFYTPYSRISVPPGESVNYSIDVINETDELKTVNIVVSGMPRQWEYTLKSGGWNIERLSVRPGEEKSVELNVNVPLKVNKGRYDFRIWDGENSSLPLSIYVSEKGTFKTRFDAEQANMEGQAGSTFTYKATLRNQTAEKQMYAFRSQAPRGWKVAFKVNYKQATSAELEANTTKDITIEVDPPDQAKAGTYKIPVVASTNGTSAKLELEVVITGSYDMSFTTPSGLVSTKITAGNDKRVELEIKNTGSSELTNIELSASKPSEWDVVFDPKEVERIEPGSAEKIFATIEAPRSAIAGDYVTKFNAETPEVTKDVSFRVTVRTSMLIGWLGVVIILVAIGIIYYLFRKYGRR